MASQGTARGWGRTSNLIIGALVLGTLLVALALDRADTVDAAPPLVLSGGGAAGWQDTDRFVLERGPTTFEVRYGGPGGFRADLMDGRHWSLRLAEALGDANSLGWPGGRLPRIAEAAGPVETTTTIQVRDSAKYYLHVRADGPWSISVAQSR